MPRSAWTGSACGQGGRGSRQTPTERWGVGWRLIGRACRERKAGIGVAGVLVGLGWTAGQGVGRAARAARSTTADRGRRHGGAPPRGRSASPSPPWSSAPSPASGATSPSARPGGSRPTCGSGCSPTSSASTSRSTTTAQTGQLMSRANTDLQQIQAFVVMIPLTISNAGDGARRGRDPRHHRPGAHAARARDAAVPQRRWPRRFAPRLHPAVMGDPGGVGRARRRGGGDRRGRPRS